jgi:glucose/mannose transport system substrate-binding protein
MKRLFAVALALLVLLVPAGLFANGQKEAPKEQKLEIFSWWTAGGEAEGLAAMAQIYKQKYPNIEFINATVAGGAGSNAQAVLATRMQGGNPPDSFQVHAGHSLIDSYVVAGQMEPITFILKDAGFMNKFPKGVLDVISYKGEVYSIPVNIHRANVMWFNKKIFADNNLKPPMSIDEFFTAAEALSAKGITPLALGDNGIWCSTQILETLLIGIMGPEKYKGLWNGKTAWNDPDVGKALATFAKVLKYVNTDHAALSWDAAAQYVVDGKCAMTLMGDWAEGYFKAKGLKPNVEFGWFIPFGSNGSFDMLSDSFGLPKGAPHRDAVVKWLTLCASKEGQDAFNPKKGSIPSRIDGDKKLYDEYLQSAMASFGKDAIVPSCAHGAAAADGWGSKINDVMTVFVSDQNVDMAVDGFVKAAQGYVK